MYVYTLSSESSLQLNWQSCSLNNWPWDPCFVYKSLENFSTKECFWGFQKWKNLRLWQLVASKEKLRMIESQLKQAISLYKRRLEWLTTER